MVKLVEKTNQFNEVFQKKKFRLPFQAQKLTDDACLQDFL